MYELLGTQNVGKTALLRDIERLNKGTVYLVSLRREKNILANLITMLKGKLFMGNFRRYGYKYKYLFYL
jgi:hypothetical protein